MSMNRRELLKTATALLAGASLPEPVRAAWPTGSGVYIPARSAPARYTLNTAVSADLRAMTNAAALRMESFFGVPAPGYRAADVALSLDHVHNPNDPRRFIRYMYQFQADVGASDSAVLAAAIGDFTHGWVPFNVSPAGRLLRARILRLEELGLSGAAPELLFVDRMTVETKPDPDNARLMCRIVEDYAVAG